MPIESIAAASNLTSAFASAPQGVTEAPASEWNIQGVSGLGAEAQISQPVTEAKPGGFGELLTSQVKQLNSLQVAADQQQQALATGQADDIASVVVSAERAQLAFQMATSMRNRVVDAYNELMRTQI